jgi:hypothetical protein
MFLGRFKFAFQSRWWQTKARESAQAAELDGSPSGERQELDAICVELIQK